MKILGLHNNYSVPSLPETPVCGAEKESCVSIISYPDVALLAGGKPFFIPSGSDEWEVFPSVAIRISRLGKSIAAKFAHRYYSEAAFGFNFRNRTLLERLRLNGLPWTEAVGSDYSTPLGKFESATRLLHPATSVSVSFSDRDGNEQGEEFRYSPANLLLDADHAIEHISRRFTLKDGDIIFLGFPTRGIIADRPGSITASIDGKPLIITKIR